MILALYKNLSERNVLAKQVVAGDSLNGNIRDDLDVVHPRVVIQTTVPSGYNYCYIPSLSRWYFIDSVTALSNNLMELSLTVDVLMSFRNAIFNLEAVISSNENEGNVYLLTSNYPCEERQFMQVKSFENGEAFETDGVYFLIAAGG